MIGRRSASNRCFEKGHHDEKDCHHHGERDTGGGSATGQAAGTKQRLAVEITPEGH
jgi:hypothetical protein